MIKELYKITWEINNIPLIEVNNKCIEYDLELDVNNMEVIIINIFLKQED